MRGLLRRIKYYVERGSPTVLLRLLLLPIWIALLIYLLITLPIAPTALLLLTGVR